MRKIFLVLPFLFACSPDNEGVKISSVTPIANVDSVLTVLDSLDKVRKALPDPTTNAAKKVYAEELFKYRMIDTLAVSFPILNNRTAAVISSRIDSIILRHGHPDSTTDRGKLIGNRIDAFLALSLEERKSRIKAQKFLGKIIYASRDELIMVVEQYEHQINSATKLQAIKKLVIGRLHAVEGTSSQAFSFSDVTSFDNLLIALRAGYFESEIR